MPRKSVKSEAAFARARKMLVGGVNSPVRVFAAVGGTPPVIARAKGSQITDVDLTIRAAREAFSAAGRLM